jgi:sortase A
MHNNRWLRWSRCLFVVVGILMLSYVGFVELEAHFYQADQSRKFQQELNALRPSVAGEESLHKDRLSSVPANESIIRTQGDGHAGLSRSSLGRIEIDSIGLSAMILEGTDARTLRLAVGHIPGTALPGQQGNVVITGHRDTYFRELRNIHKDDEIKLTTLGGSYRYWVDSIKVVAPKDTQVLNNSKDAILTLITCYPFYYVGPAPKRFIVRAHRIPG